MAKVTFWVDSNRIPKKLETTVEIPDSSIDEYDKTDWEFLAADYAAELYGPQFYVSDALIQFGYIVLAPE